MIEKIKAFLRWYRHMNYLKVNGGVDPCADLLSRYNALVEEIAQRQETEESLTKWVHDLGIKYDALEEAARPVAEWWKYKDTHCDVMPVPMLLDRLAALVGEEGI